MRNRIRRFMKFLQAARTVDDSAHTDPFDARGGTAAFEIFREDGERAERAWLDPSRPDRTGWTNPEDKQR